MSKGWTSTHREFSLTHSITSDPREGVPARCLPSPALGLCHLLDGKGWGETARWASPSPPPCTHDTFLTGLPSGAQVQSALHTFPAQHDHHIAVECRPDKTCLRGKQESRQVSLAEMGIAGVDPRTHHTWQPWVGVGEGRCAPAILHWTGNSILKGPDVSPWSQPATATQSRQAPSPSGPPATLHIPPVSY